MIEDKDVVIGILGGSGALAGLALVFLGLLATSYQGFPGDTQSSVVAPYRRAALLVLVAFGAGVAAIVLSMVWLLVDGGNRALYVLGVVALFVEVAVLAAAAIWSTYELMWRS